MSYITIYDISNSQGLIWRMAGCVATETKITDPPESWVRMNLWKLITAVPGWVGKWEAAKGVYTTSQFPPDLGARTDIITDADIREAVLLVFPPSTLVAPADTPPA